MFHLNSILRNRVEKILGCCLLFFMVMAVPLHAQSTYGAIVGTVRDRSGAMVTGALVSLLNEGTGATRELVSDAQGDFAFKNIDPGKYTVTAVSEGFKKVSMPGLTLTARQTLRTDPTLDPGAQSTTIEVSADIQSAITTEVSNLSVTQQGEELVELPVAVYSRSTGSTSPIDTLTTQSGVQTDASGNLMIMGASPELLSVTVDGISSVGVEYSGPVGEMFPSFNSIEEIRVSESNNNAEFSGVADVTTVSKAGTENFHGGIFENHENSALQAGQPAAFATSKPKLIMNDFGGTLGGPLLIPHLITHKNTFFFISYEGLRLPKESPNVVSVPSAAMRSGDLTLYLSRQQVSAINNVDGTPITDVSRVPVGATAANILKYLLPAPNTGDADSYSNNYEVNYKTPISTNQGDVRLDRTISTKQNVFARFSYKNRQVVLAPSLGCGTTFCQEGGGPMQGTYNYPEIDEGLTFAHNYIFNTNLLNEFRGGFNAQHLSATQSFNTNDLLTQLGMSAMQPDMQWAEAPLVMINGFVGTGGGNPMMQRSQIIELLDNLSWTKGRHSLKFGADFKRMSDHDDNVDGNYRSGWYAFNGTSEPGGVIGDPYTQFLLGVPDYTEFSTSNKMMMDGVGYGYAFYAQDDWKITHNLTLNLGMRYELHPPLRDTGYNTGYFLPDYTASTSDGVVHGALVVPNDEAKGFENDQLKQSIGATPTLTASEAGLPPGLRFTGKSDLGPRLGFAWRVMGNDKLVVRGGWGRFIETPTGFSLTSGFGVASTYIGYFGQEYSDAAKTTPTYTFSNPYSTDLSSSVGSNIFYWAFPIHYTDPSVQQWNLTVERDLGRGMGVRASYTGSHGSDLEAMVDLNQVKPNTYGYGGIDPNSTPISNTACGNAGSQVVGDHRPYPCWAVVQSVANIAFSNYDSATIELSRHAGKNLTFDLSYSYTRDLSNAEGIAPSSMTGVTGGASGGGWLTDRFNPGLDYGNVAYDRRQRFLGTFLYQLPFGHQQRWLSSRSLLQMVAEGWQLGGVVVAQTGPFLTPYQETSDPAGTNITTTVGLSRPDRNVGVSLYPSHRTTSNWLNASAFSVPTSDRGSFGTASVGSVVGPGTQNASLSLARDIALTGRLKFQFMLEAANILNHRNYDAPNMQMDSSSYGTITAWQTAEGAGPRCLEVSGRINF